MQTPMDDYEKKVCLFSLSESDIFPHKDVDFAIKWLLSKGERPYYFREKKPKHGLPLGSIVLFSFDAQIFGQATVKKDVEEVSFEERKQLEKKHGFIYKHKMHFDPASVEIFHYHPPKKELRDRLNMRFAQVFTYLKWDQYQEILRIARRQ